MKARIAILTNFMEFNPGNSLTGIVSNQLEMLASHGHEVFLFVNSDYHGEGQLFGTMMKVLPFTKLTDYQTTSDLSEEHQEVAILTSEVLESHLRDLKIDIVFSHDLIFQGWFVPYCLGIRKASLKLSNIKWFHWIHSIPTGQKDWWDIRLLRPNHKIVFPNRTDLLHVASQFRGLHSDMKCVHHIKDMRDWFDFSSETRNFIRKYPKSMSADVVQIYPASSDRLTAKRLGEVLQIFGAIKQQGYSVCLIVANQWATTLTRKEDLKKYKWEAGCRGLKEGEDFIFTSDFDPPEYESGIPKSMVRELFQLSNLFILPTREESFCLVLPEAALSSGCLLVLNKSLEVLAEVSGGNALFYDFGSYNKPFNNAAGDKYYVDIARAVMAKMITNEAIRARSYIRQTYNWDRLYEVEYKPLLEES